MSTLPSPLTLLKSRKTGSAICLPPSRPFRAATTAARHLNAPTFSALSGYLATSSNVLEVFRPFLFSSPIPPERWPDLFTNSDDRAALPPDVLADRKCAVPLKAAKLKTRKQIEDHCLNLVMRLPGKTSDDVSLAVSNLLKPFDVPLARHITSLSDLRQTDPKLAIAIMEDRTVDALRQIKTIGSPERRDNAVRILVRHWLLYRALHLQRAAAYTAACRRSALPFVLSFVHFHDTAANTAFAFFDVLAKASSIFMGGYLRSLRTGGKAGTPGRTSLPIEFVKAVVDKRSIRPARADEPAFATALHQHAPTLLAKIPYIFDVVSTQRRDGLDRKASLYVAANLPAADAKALTMFEIWHLGLSPAAMLLVFAQRYVEAAAIVEAVLRNPALVWSEDVSVSDQPDAYVVDVARDMADAIMGAAAPSLSNTIKPHKLAKKFLGLNLKPTGRSQTLERHLLAAFDPMLGAHWKAMPSSAAIG